MSSATINGRGVQSPRHPSEAMQAWTHLLPVYQRLLQDEAETFDAPDHLNQAGIKLDYNDEMLVVEAFERLGVLHRLYVRYAEAHGVIETTAPMFWYWLTQSEEPLLEIVAAFVARDGETSKRYWPVIESLADQIAHAQMTPRTIALPRERRPLRELLRGPKS